jgi:hypothetical protein
MACCFTLFFAVILAIPTFIIYSHVKQMCLKAKSMYGQTCVTALIIFAQDKSNAFSDRNTAIWALGQLADKNAIKYLEYEDIATPEQRVCDYSAYVCKYEIQKALKWCRQGNITHWMYQGKVFR